MEENRKSGEGNQFLSFFLKEEMFAVNVFHVREIIQYTQITRVPMMQSFVMGITNIRGNVIPVIDLSDRLGLGQSPIDKKTCVVTVETEMEGEETEVGIVIDVVDQVYDVAPTHKMDSPEFGSRVPKKFMEMMAKVDDRFITVLDMKSVLALADLAVTQPRKTLQG